MNGKVQLILCWCFLEASSISAPESFGNNKQKEKREGWGETGWYRRCSGINRTVKADLDPPRGSSKRTPWFIRKEIFLVSKICESQSQGVTLPFGWEFKSPRRGALKTWLFYSIFQIWSLYSMFYIRPGFSTCWGNARLEKNIPRKKKCQQKQLREKVRETCSHGGKERE